MNRDRRTLYGILILLGILTFMWGLAVVAHFGYFHYIAAKLSLLKGSPAAAIEGTSFLYSFNVDGTLEETATSELSPSPYWWLDSGGELRIKDGVGSTVVGELATLSRWRVAYGKSNPIDSDNGYHPQNIFRLVGRTIWRDVRAETSFRILADRINQSPHRNESNGLLLMTRYLDGDNLYYAGIRVDGTAVIKKKYRGIYYTLAQRQIFSGSYNASTSPNLLPHDTWLTLRVEVKNLFNGSVSISLSLQREGDPEGSWTKVLEVIDDGRNAEMTNPISSGGYVGIRTDFMDVEFKDFRLERI